jgi:hypothetical protein
LLQTMHCTDLLEALKLALSVIEVGLQHSLTNATKPGIGTLPFGRERLPTDDPDVRLTLPT